VERLLVADISCVAGVRDYAEGLARYWPEGDALHDRNWTCLKHDLQAIHAFLMSDNGFSLAATIRIPSW